MNYAKWLACMNKIEEALTDLGVTQPRIDAVLTYTKTCVGANDSLRKMRDVQTIASDYFRLKPEQYKKYWEKDVIPIGYFMMKLSRSKQFNMGDYEMVESAINLLCDLKHLARAPQDWILTTYGSQCGQRHLYSWLYPNESGGDSLVYTNGNREGIDLCTLTNREGID